jgi:hypothetical protein
MLQNAIAPDIIPPHMASRISHGLLWSYPSRKKLFLLVVLVVATLTVLGIFLLLKSKDLETAPQVPLVRPTVHLTLPEKTNTPPLPS